MICIVLGFVPICNVVEGHYYSPINQPGRNMANVKYFNDTNGVAVELKHIDRLRNEEFAKRFPDVKGFRYDGYYMQIGYADGATMDHMALPVTRKIEFKSNPSRHECNSKCLNGKHNGSCECQCGGKNHGRGMFTGLIAA